MANPETDLIAELRALAGVGDENDFVIQRGPHRIEVRYRSGSSSSLALRARYDEVARADHQAIVAQTSATGAYRRSGRAPGLVAVRPLAITLRSETSSDVEHKRAGINVEHQTGDEDFDRNVYVSTPTTDAHVLHAVLGPRVRRGVLALLALGFHRVDIDDGGAVEAYLSAFTQRQPRPGRGASAVDSFALIVSDLPAIRASGGAHVAPPVWARAVPLWIVMGVAGALGLPASCSVAEATHCTESHRDNDGEWSENFRDGCGTPAFLALLFALLVAIVAAVVARAVATPRLRGRSNSSGRILHVRAAAFWLTLVAAYTIASLFAFIFLRR